VQILQASFQFKSGKGSDSDEEESGSTFEDCMIALSPFADQFLDLIGSYALLWKSK